LTASLHVGLVSQRPSTQATPAGQWLPQPPQFSGSLVVSAQHPATGVPSGSSSIATVAENGQHPQHPQLVGLSTSTVRTTVSYPGASIVTGWLPFESWYSVDMHVQRHAGVPEG
jgi:hypothetical protein